MTDDYQLIIFDWEGTLKSSSCYRVELVPGAMEVLQQLKKQQCLIAVATGCSSRGLQHDLHALGLESWFDATRTSEQTWHKPDPMMVDEILMQLGIDRGHVLIVGDNVCDIQLAKNGGCDGMGVDFGRGNTQELLEAGAVTVINDYSDFFSSLARESSGND